jgi:hypothetical protein
VRSRADFPVETGLSGDASNRDAALASGAHFVSGDYLTPTAHERYDADFAAMYSLPFDPARPAYETLLPGGTPARCNPVSAPVECVSTDVEDLPAVVATTTTTTAPASTTSTTTPPPALAAAALPIAATPAFTG